MLISDFSLTQELTENDHSLPHLGIILVYVPTEHRTGRIGYELPPPLLREITKKVDH